MSVVDKTRARVERAQQVPVISFVVQVVEIVTTKNLPGFAQMMAYSVLFATVPFLMVIVAGAALMTRLVNADLENPALPVLNWMQDYLPNEVVTFLEGPIEMVLNQSHSTAFAIGAVLALWGVRGAIAAIIRGLNVAYGVGRDPRGFIVTNAISLMLAILVVLAISVGGIIFTLGTNFGREIAHAIGLQDVYLTFSNMVRWPMVVSLAVLGVMVLHWLGPATSHPFVWYLPGAVFTVVGVHVSTWALTLWFGRVGFDQTYGVFGSVMAFIFYLWILGLVLLIGGAINAVAHGYMPSPASADE